MERNAPNPNTTPSPAGDTGSKRTLVSRTSIITMLAIGGVALAGSAAIAANIGILNSTDDDQLGALSANDLETSTTLSPQVIDIVLDAPAATSTSTTSPITSSTTSPAATSDDQRFTVDDAGVVTLRRSADQLLVADVALTPGWTADVIDGSALVTIQFAGDGRTIVFAASIGAAGEIDVDLTEPIVVTATLPGPAATTPSVTATTAPNPFDDDHDNTYDDDSHDGDHDDDDDERDDDDSYEGADDDD